MCAPPPNRGSSWAFNPDIPRYDPDTRSFNGNPRAYAAKFPDLWEANAFREGKYPDPTTFISGHLARDYPKPQPSYAQATATGAPKGKKTKSTLTAAKVASTSIVVPVVQALKSLPTAERWFYAPRSSPSEHPQAPLAVAFAPYFDAPTAQLNKSFPVGDSPWWPFCLAPNEVQLAIHSLLIAVLLKDPNELFPCLAESILNSKDIRILAARYLNPNAESREGKSTTSVIVSVHPGYVPTMGFSIRVFSRSRTIERAYSSNRYTQCKNGWGYGHVAPRCPLPDPVCPIYSLNLLP